MPTTPGATWSPIGVTDSPTVAPAKRGVTPLPLPLQRKDLEERLLPLPEERLRGRTSSSAEEELRGKTSSSVEGKLRGKRLPLFRLET